MKQIKMTMLVIFAMLILIPVAAFSWKPGITSEIDNRMLAENPFHPKPGAEGEDMSKAIENYVNDRLGFRNQMILGYTVLNDKLFGKMVHPIYQYGQGGYVYTTTLGNEPDRAFEEAFADMVGRIQDYCEARSIPFLFAIEPSKSSVLTEYLPRGWHVDHTWWDILLEALDKREINYINNTELMKRLTAEGESVFNQKYDAGHWNYTGSFYGVNAILEELRNDFPGIHINTWEELTVSKKLETSLPVSQFPIREWVPDISIALEAEDLTEKYSNEVVRNLSYHKFGDFVNENRLKQGSPRALVFQGSYINEYGTSYLKNALGEYIYVHNYENIIDFDYYFNIFKPECVVFEVTEYALTRGYFDYDRMISQYFNPVMASVMKKAEKTEKKELLPETISWEQGEALTKIVWNGGDGSEEYVWLFMDEDFDMRKKETEIYETTVKNEALNLNNIKIVVQTKEGIHIYE